MDVARPYAALLGDALAGEVLTVLAGTTKPLTGRQVARMVRHGSDRGVRLALNRMAEQGLIDVMPAPPALLYSLNREHIAAPVAEAIAGLRAELVERLQVALEAWRIAPAHASMFGSAARGDGGPASDIDLFLVRPDDLPEDDEQWREQVDGLADQVRRWTGNHAGISDMSEASLRRVAANRPAVIDEVRRDGIRLAGRSAEEILRSAEDDV